MAKTLPELMRDHAAVERVREALVSCTGCGTRLSEGEHVACAKCTADFDKKRSKEVYDKTAKELELIRRRVEELNKDLLCLLERAARQVLKSNPELREFVMGNGTYCFTDQRGETAELALREEGAVPLILQEYDEVFQLSGTPMRFTATGPLREDW